MSRNITWDICRGLFVSSGRNSRPTCLSDALGELTGQDTRITVNVVEPICPGANSLVPVDLEGKFLTLLIQRPDATPVAGTFTATYGGESTSEISIHASLYDVQSALNSLSTIAAHGYVDVKSANICLPHYGNKCNTTNCFGQSCKCNDEACFVICFRTCGDKLDFTFTCSGLYPKSCAQSQVICQGSDTDCCEKEVVSVQFREDVIASVQATDWTKGTDPVISLTTTTEGTATVKEVQRVTISPDPVKGYFRIGDSTDCLSDPIGVFSGASDLQAAINGLTCSNTVKVIQSDCFTWDIYFSDAGSREPLIVEGLGICGASSFTGKINYNEALLCSLFKCPRSRFAAQAQFILTDIEEQCVVSSSIESVIFQSRLN